MDKELFLKYVHSNYSSKELDEIINWMKKDATTLAGNIIIRDAWEEFETDPSLFNEEVKSSLLDKIHHSINLQTTNQSYNNDISTSGRILRIISNYVYRAAAILLIPVLTLLIYNYVNQVLYVPFVSVKATFNEIVAPIGSRTYIELDDGTEVWLNHGSKLMYPQKFMGENRTVFLEGEGYFNVEHNSNLPFIVETENFMVKALGTEFNVNAYADDNLEGITLVEGKVLIQKRVDNKATDIYKMFPEQHFEFNKSSRQYNCVYTQIDKYTSWKDGILMFHNDPIDKIANKLNRWYNVDIEITSETVKSYTYTATFIDETLPQILELLEIATPITYKIYTREKLPNGTFSKMKVEIGVKEQS